MVKNVTSLFLCVRSQKEQDLPIVPLSENNNSQEAYGDTCLINYIIVRLQNLKLITFSLIWRFIKTSSAQLRQAQKAQFGLDDLKFLIKYFSVNCINYFDLHLSPNIYINTSFDVYLCLIILPYLGIGLIMTFTIARP